MNISLSSSHPYHAYRCLVAAVLVLQNAAIATLLAHGDDDQVTMLRHQALITKASAVRLRYLYEVEWENQWPEEYEGMDAEEIAAHKRLEDES